jgi:glycosyltransferase involved in cell wall biosynthesis
MINIISRSVLSPRIRGPKKVVENLILGLKKIGYPYVLNKSLDSTKRLWIHDDIAALKYLHLLPDRVKTVVGPNLFVNPDEIPPTLDFSKIIYLQPSENVKRIWQKRGMIGRMAVWPVGIDTEKFKPTLPAKKFILVYFKNRKEEELRQVLLLLTSQNLNYRLVRYGQYSEDQYIQLLKSTSFVVWLGGPESQGLALEEALAANIPVLVIDEGRTEFGERLTAAPYFNGQCGLKINSLEKLPEALEKMNNQLINFEPREYILQNLSLEKQARDFVDLFDIYFDLSYETGLRENLQSQKDWRNNKFYFKLLMKIKDIIRR